MENLRGSVLMILAMAGFALEDTFIKRLALDLSVGQILLLMGIGGAIIFGFLTVARGERLISTDLLTLPVILRNLGELAGALGFVSALALIDLSAASAILQATPLAVTFGAAIFLGEVVGWRRWSAILVGFTGVLMVIRPGFSAFEPAALLALASVFCLALRDLATRFVAPKVSSMQLSAYAFAMLIPGGIVLSLVMGDPVLPGPFQWFDLLGTMAFGCLGYYAIVAAMRVGEVSFVTPFRYTRLIFALILGVLLFGERPDIWTLTGSAIIILSGLYTLLRERKLAGNA